MGPGKLISHEPKYKAYRIEREDIMSEIHLTPKISADELRNEVKKEYTNVALDPHKGYHFHTGRAALKRIGYAYNERVV
ncbi:MAG: hypothetical protein ACQ9MH_18405 [Nitrospinales bacterium]